MSIARPVISIVACTLIGTAAIQFLAGYFFLWSIHSAPQRASLLTIWRYAYYFGSDPGIRRRLLTCSGLSFALVIGCTATAFLPKPRSLHGDARFARVPEIEDAGLFNQDGLLLGELSSRYLTLGGQQSVILAAPPRSGKGVGIVIPNALNWRGSLVCVDIKRENWTITAGYRATHGHACYLFDPLSEEGRTARWNCLTYVSPTPAQRINDLQRIADIFYSDTPGTDPFWTASARSLFVGIALYLFETPSLPRTIGEIRRQGMANDDEGFAAHWKRIIEGRQSGINPLSDECVRALYDVIDLAPVTASSVRKTFTSRLDLFGNPLLDYATSADDFDLRELRKRLMSVYVAINPDDLHRLRPVLSLFFQQSLGLQTRELPEHNPRLKHQVLMLLDEFTALGRIPIISEAIAYLPGYDVRVLIVIQALSQLRSTYGRDDAETMLKSVAARIVYAPRDYPDAKEISDDLGTITVKARSHSRPSFASGGRQSQRARNTTISDHARALLLPQEVREIGKRRAIIFYENLRPILARKICYYSDRRFQERLMPPPSKPTATWSPNDVLEYTQAAARRFNVKRKRTEVPDGHAQGAAAVDTFETAVTDLDALDYLTLDDFGDALRNLKFQHAGERPTESELEQDVERFIAALR